MSSFYLLPAKTFPFVSRALTIATFQSQEALSFSHHSARAFNILLSHTLLILYLLWDQIVQSEKRRRKAIGFVNWTVKFPSLRVVLQAPTTVSDDITAKLQKEKRGEGERILNLGLSPLESELSGFFCRDPLFLLPLPRPHCLGFRLLKFKSRDTRRKK